MAKKTYGRTAEGPPCYLTHKPVKLGEGTLLGGRCSDPITEDADVYIAFDVMTYPIYARSFPWNAGESFLYPIPNGHVPKNPDEFKKLVEWTCVQLEEGALVHAGCIGGHGRTGLFIAAVVASFALLEVPRVGDLIDATTWVRENYCEKVVETPIQVDFLEEHFGIAPVTASYVQRGRMQASASDAYPH